MRNLKVRGVEVKICEGFSHLSGLRFKIPEPAPRCGLEQSKANLELSVFFFE